jgi:hypothetical protein
MVNRTHRVLTLLEETSNWDGHTDSANSLNGGYGKWDTASDQPTDPHYNAIKKTLLSACERVNLATNAFVQPDDLVLVVSPGLAQRMANTAEIHNYVKYGPFSKEALEKGANARWGLPPTLYGFDVIVEDAVRVSSRMSADGTQASGSSRTYIKSDTSALLLSRKGGINGTYGTNSFATVQLYFYDWEMATYVFDDPKHERTDGHVTDCFAEVLAAPQAGYLITSVL